MIDKLLFRHFLILSILSKYSAERPARQIDLIPRTGDDGVITAWIQEHGITRDRTPQIWKSVSQFQSVIADLRGLGLVANDKYYGYYLTDEGKKIAQHYKSWVEFPKSIPVDNGVIQFDQAVKFNRG